MFEAIERILPTDSPLELFFCYLVGFAAAWYIYGSQFKREHKHVNAAGWALIIPVVPTIWSLIHGGNPAHISYLEMAMVWLAYISVVGTKWYNASWEGQPTR